MLDDKEGDSIGRILIIESKEGNIPVIEEILEKLKVSEKESQR